MTVNKRQLLEDFKQDLIHIKENRESISYDDLETIIMLIEILQEEDE